MQSILIYGSSIFLCGLAKQLQNTTQLTIKHCLHLNELGDLATFEAVMVDLNDPVTRDVLSLLRVRPDLKVIGVNDAAGTLTVLTGKIFLAQRLDDIAGYLTQ